MQTTNKTDCKHINKALKSLERALEKSREIDKLFIKYGHDWSEQVVKDVESDWLANW